MSWFSSLFTGNSPQLNSSLSNTGQLAGFASGQGQNNTTQGSGFFSSLFSGDPTKIGQTLAPAISAGQQGVQQQKNEIANFGNRSGGNNAKSQSLDSANRGNITNMIGGLQAGAASSLLSSGQSLLGTALSGYGQEAGIADQQMKDWQSSIFGGALTSGAAIGAKALGAWAGG